MGAAGPYGSLWITVFYAGSAMPDHYTAMGATAAVGCFLAPRPRYAGVAAHLAVVTLMRRNDGLAVATPLLLAALLMSTLRDNGRLRVRLSALAAGLVAGALPWIVEAEGRFGGVRKRFAETDDVQGGLRAVFSLRAHLTALDGPLLCRPCTGDSVIMPVMEWWVLLPLLVGPGLWAERRAGRSVAPLGPAVAVAAAVARSVRPRVEEPVRQLAPESHDRDRLRDVFLPALTAEDRPFLVATDGDMSLFGSTDRLAGLRRCRPYLATPARSTAP